MEKNLPTDPFEDYVRRTFENLDESPSPEMWARIDAEMLPDNLSMKKIARKLGFRSQAADDPTSLRAVLDL